MLVRLVYASRACNAIDEALITAILQESRANNLEHGITGVLCVDHPAKIFLQLIEGSRASVNALYSNIIRDTRHEEVFLLDFGEIEQRRFSSWRMGRVALSKVNLSTILRFCEKPQLDPHTMTGASALALIEELASSAAIVRGEAG